MHQKDGKWSVKQVCESHEKCVKAMGLLYGLESGDIKKEDVGKKQEEGRDLKNRYPTMFKK